MVLKDDMKILNRTFTEKVLVELFKNGFNKQLDTGYHT